VLTDKEQTVIRPIPFAGMPTVGTGLTSIVGIHFDRHAVMQKRLIGDHGVQFSKGPFGVDRIGPPLLLARMLAFAPFGPVSNLSQVFQADERMRMCAHESLTHDMVGVLLQPSLSPAHHHQTAGGRTSAFFLKTLADACVMIGLGNDTFAGMQRGR